MVSISYYTDVLLLCSLCFLLSSLAFEICFDMDTPRVNGSELFLSFASTVPLDSAMCFVETLELQNCKLTIDAHSAC